MRNVLFGLVILGGCGRLANEPPPPAESASKSEPKSEAGAKDQPAPTAKGSLEVALAAAMDHAVVQPVTDDATYRVDPFIAALVYEAVRKDGGAPWFELVQRSGDAPAGYRVVDAPDGSWLHRLGLRSGDVIETVNGIALADRSALPTVLDGADNRVNVSLFREDVSFTLSYRFADGLAWRDVLMSAGTPEEQPETPTQPEVVAVADPPPEPAQPSGPSARPPRDTPDEPPITEPPKPSKPSKLPGSGGSSRPPSGGSPPPATNPSGGSKPTPSNPPSNPGPTPSQPNPADPIQCQGNQCTIAKWYFDDLIASPERLERDANVVPAIRNDVFSGYKLKTVRPGSAPAKLGFRSEDKITSVNGYDLTDDAQALQLYWSLSATKVFKIRFERNGQSMLKTVVVR